MKRGDGKCLRILPNLPFVPRLVCIGSGYHYWWLFLCPLNPWSPGIWQIRSKAEDRGCCHSKPLFCQQPLLNPTLPQNRNLYAMLEELICGHHTFICINLFLVFYFNYLSHESTATGFLDCSSVGPLGSIWLHIARVPLPAFGGFSHRLYMRGQHGARRGGWGVFTSRDAL